MAIDVACPHSHLGCNRLNSVLQTARGDGNDIDIRFLPAQIASDTLIEPEPLTEAHKRLLGPAAVEHTTTITRQGREDGINVRFDVAQFVNTRDAHLLLALAHGPVPTPWTASPRWWKQ